MKKMNTRVRTSLQTMKTSIKTDKMEKQEKNNKLMESDKAPPTRRRSRRERKMALIQDVDKLKKKLRHEESVHRALERAFTRPLGALPRLPPYLPPNTLELLAEVAVLEEEVVRLEEQVVNFRQGLYEEAVHISSSKKSIANPPDLQNSPFRNPKEQPKSLPQANVNLATSTSRPLPSSLPCNPSSSTQLPSTRVTDKAAHCSIQPTNGKQPLRKTNSTSPVTDDRRGKENQSCTNSSKNNKPSRQPGEIIVATTKRVTMEHRSEEKHLVPLKLQLECRELDQERTKESSPTIPDKKILEEDNNSPNKTSENILKCLISIFLRMRSRRSRGMSSEMFPYLFKLSSSESCVETEFRDPYGICKECGYKDIGAYKQLFPIEPRSIDANLNKTASLLIQRLKLLLEKLSSVNLQGLGHQQKLAFWINIYNSCMMNAFLEHGIPESPQLVIALMQKARINVGGNSVNAMIIEHFILRLPYHSKYTYSKGTKTDEMTVRSAYGLEWSEPLVTFALSCGSWSSPTVRVYTASEVENELEVAKRDYLQAAVGISTSNKLVIPKLLDWYLLDFAKDMKSLLEWVCLQLPDEQRIKALACLERGDREPLSQLVQVMPYEFNFRYLLHQ